MSAIFVMSTGRCGTQWLARNFSATLPHDWRVTHEPLHFDYAPIHNSPAEPLNRNAPILMAHLRSILLHLDRGGHYLECGFPCWRHLEWFRAQLGGDVKVVHLHRDPVATARSWLKQNAFVPPLLPHLPTKELFRPTAPGALLAEYAEQWTALTPFEKNLYYWAEVQQQAHAYRSRWNVSDWFTLPYTQLMNKNVLSQLEIFLAANCHTASWDLTKQDSYPGLEQAPVAESLLDRHPRVQQLAASLGY